MNCRRTIPDKDTRHGQETISVKRKETEKVSKKKDTREKNLPEEWLNLRMTRNSMEKRGGVKRLKEKPQTKGGKRRGLGPAAQKIGFGGGRVFGRKKEKRKGAGRANKAKIPRQGGIQALKKKGSLR